MSMISKDTLVRGADGRLYAITAAGVAEIAEAGAAVGKTLRAGDRASFDTVDHEAARTAVNPGL